MIKKQRNQSIKFYYYHPELATSITFWSLTFGVFFLGVISILEKSHLIFPIVIFSFFILLLYLSSKRKIFLEKDKLQIKAILKKNEQEVLIRKMKEVSIGKYGFTLKMDDSPEETFEFLMMNKHKKKFFDDLLSHKQFNGKISSIEKSVRSK